jgi:hypothetical protein
MGNDFANAVLIARQRPGKLAKDDPGVDMERWTGAHLPNRVAQRVDARHQQVRPTVKQVHRKKERSTRNPIARPRRTAECAPGLGKNSTGLEECRASFEASLREAPQDEVFFLMPSAT